MQVVLTKRDITNSTCCAQLMQWLAMAMSDYTQLWRLFPTVPSGVLLLDCLLTKPVDFSMHASHISWHSIEIPYSIMEPCTLYLIMAIIIMQRRRRNIFHETVTNLYTIRYEKCVYNTLLAHNVNYTGCAHTIARYYTMESGELRRLVFSTLADTTTDQQVKDKCEHIIDPYSTSTSNI